jgi:hypothetical protein
VVIRSKSKVGKLAGHALVSYQDIFRLEVPVVNSIGMAKLHGIQNLKESSLGQGIITNELALLGDIREQVTFGTILHDNVCAVGRVHDLYQRDNIGVKTGLMVELNFSLLELPLPWL